jgi:hypothetical protein
VGEPLANAAGRASLPQRSPGRGDPATRAGGHDPPRHFLTADRVLPVTNGCPPAKGRCR